MINKQTQPTSEQLKKYEQLLAYFESLGSAAVAFSSGVDSTFLVYAAKQALGDRVLAVTASSGSFPKRELSEATNFCIEQGIRHEICVTKELEIEGFAQNPPNRCYLCKRELFRGFLDVAKRENLAAVVEGSNLDDTGDYRPGMQAIAELGIKSPLRELGFTKEDIRVLSKHLNLPTWNKMSFACLASRFVYGETITAEKLAMVEKAEQLLFDLGFSQVRVRMHGKMARIELLPNEFEKMLSADVRSQIAAKLKEYGFDYVAMDLTGYRTGSMNEVL